MLVFGASGRIGGPLARFARFHAPDVKLRLATSTSAKAAQLEAEFPDAEVVGADYLDADSLTAALSGAEAVFLVTPDFLDEVAAMENFVAAFERAGSVRHVVRILGDLPNMTLERISDALHFRKGTAVQHFAARQVLEGAKLPVTYVNSAAYYMDDYLYWTAAVRRSGRLLMPYDRVVAYIDPRELGEVAGRILLSGDPRHIDQHYNIDNGQDLIRFEEATRMLAEVLRQEIEYVDDPDVFLAEAGPRYVELFGEGGDRYYMECFRFEQENQFAFRRTDFAESVLGRKPKTLRAWFEEHREVLLTGPEASAG
jgi:uncharacterized protein YbjT (DUF2867 family)